MAGGAYNLRGGKPIAKHKAERSNIEREANDANAEKKQLGGFDKFPMHTHKPGGLVREVLNEEDLSDALAKGWCADIREIETPEPDETPTLVSQMTPKQAAKAIKDASAVELAAIEADETAHGNRAAVIALINDAKDSIGGAKTSTKSKYPRK